MSILVLAMVCLGLVLGWLTHGAVSIPSSIEFVLFSIMLFGIGVELGQDRSLWQRLRQSGWKIAVFPLNVVLGTLAGCLFATFLLHLKATEILAIGAGFGWYSLAAILLNQLDGAQAATVAFMANVLRELLSFVLIPWVARYGQGAIAVSLAGATAMDTTLPLITRYTHAEVGMYAFVSGVITSTLVPVLIPLLMHL